MNDHCEVMVASAGQIPIENCESETIVATQTPLIVMATSNFCRLVSTCLSAAV